MSYSSTRETNIQDELGAFCHIKKEESAREKKEEGSFGLTNSVKADTIS